MACCQHLAEQNRNSHKSTGYIFVAGVAVRDAAGRPEPHRVRGAGHDQQGEQQNHRTIDVEGCLLQKIDDGSATLNFPDFCLLLAEKSKEVDPETLFKENELQ